MVSCDSAAEIAVRYLFPLRGARTPTFSSQLRAV